jgi:hypothetical protein
MLLTAKRNRDRLKIIQNGKVSSMMNLYSFECLKDGNYVPIGPLPSDEMAIALLEKQVGGCFTLEDKGGKLAYLMKRSSDGWGRPNIRVYHA